MLIGLRKDASGQYGFLDFVSHQAAAQVLLTLNGTPIPGTDKPFRLIWAGLGSNRPQEGALITLPLKPLWSEKFPCGA